ncbi:hypothetical protein C8Q73DRAFT_834944 [Cubamyces lactineus]|nr:hypothetical protein C8Q73DRAFT_834944 [Cubamyces lactineus]
MHPILPPSPPVSRMPERDANKRNVVLRDYHGLALAGFYQYGTVTWQAFFRWLSLLFDTTQSWIIVAGDRFHAQQYFPTDALVVPGCYTLLDSDWSPIHIKLTPAHARRLHPQSTRTKVIDNINRFRSGKDKQCPMSAQELCWCGLQAAHMDSWTHPKEWKCKAQAHASPTEEDAAADRSAGSGPSASAAAQGNVLPNMLLLREDLHRAWGEYEFGVDPDDGYRITAFVAGHDSIAGRVLRLDHIVDPTTRPLDQLLRDHFLQGLLKHVKGSGERHWDFRSGALDLSDDALWGTEQGKERLEVELEHRLSDHRVKQQQLSCSAESRAASGLT